MTAQAGDATSFPENLHREDRRQLRRRLREVRRELSIAERRRASAAVARALARLPDLHRARRIACYLAMPGEGEIDLRPVIERAFRRGVEVYLPVISGRGGRLRFARLRPDTPLVENWFGIAEPAPQAREYLSPLELDVVLAPLVAFDARGNRLGMGAGLYDRSFAFLLTRRHWRRPRLIGVAHDCQRVEQLEPSPWDVPLERIVTERGIYEAGSARRGSP